MSATLAVKHRRKAAKAKRRNAREADWRKRTFQPSAHSAAIPGRVGPADSYTYWVLRGDELQGRPAPLYPPDKAPLAGVGRWVAQAAFRLGDLVVGNEGTTALVFGLPRDVNAFPQLRPLAAKRVEQFFDNGEQHVLHVHFDGQDIRVTPGHPWYVVGRGWVQTAQLRPGDRLQRRDGGGVLEGVEDLGEALPVYNLQVADHRTYFVGSPNAQSAVLVHNASWSGFWEGVKDTAAIGWAGVKGAGHGGVNIAVGLKDTGKELALESYDFGAGVVEVGGRLAGENWRFDSQSNLGQASLQPGFSYGTHAAETGATSSHSALTERARQPISFTRARSQ